MFSSSFYPTMPLLGLSDDEQDLIRRLQSIGNGQRAAMELSDAYYCGTQIVRNLRIAVPKELEDAICASVGWAALAVDPYVERHSLDCFRLPTGTDADEYLTSIADANGLNAEIPIAFTDALALGRAYWMVGSAEESGTPPRITVESPLNTTVGWDRTGRVARAAITEYRDENDQRRGVLLAPNQSIHLATNDRGEWEVAWRDQHDFGFVPLIRQANKARSNDRNGRSAITHALRTTIDATCRTLMGLGVAGEIYSAPRMILSGATENTFVDANGKARNAWDTYITRVLGLERDEDGNVPDLKQLTVYDPATFTKIIDNAAARAASEVLATPQDIGLYAEGNPVSADALNATEARRNRRAKLQQASAGVDLAEVVKLAVRFDNGGILPDKYKQIATDWESVEEDDPQSIAQAISMQIASGSIPATSDVTLKRLGWNAVERRRLEQDRKRDEGNQAARQIADALGALQPQPALEPATNGSGIQ